LQQITDSEGFFRDLSMKKATATLKAPQNAGKFFAKLSFKKAEKLDTQTNYQQP